MKTIDSDNYHIWWSAETMQNTSIVCLLHKYCNKIYKGCLQKASCNYVWGILTYYNMHFMWNSNKWLPKWAAILTRPNIKLFVILDLYYIKCFIWLKLSFNIVLKQFVPSSSDRNSSSDNRYSVYRDILCSQESKKSVTNLLQINYCK